MNIKGGDWWLSGGHATSPGSVSAGASSQHGVMGSNPTETTGEFLVGSGIKSQHNNNSRMGYLIVWVRSMSLVDICLKDKGLMCLHMMHPCFSQVSNILSRAKRAAYRLDVGMIGYFSCWGLKFIMGDHW